MIPTPSDPATTTSGGAGGRMVTADGRTLPLRFAQLEAEAGAGVARVILTQRFVNPHNQPIDVEYLLPLPSDGAVSGFAFTLGDHRIVGEVDKKQRARERFEQALVEGRTAGLLEQERTSLFTQTLGNVPPGAELIAEITIDQPLTWLEEGAWEWRFPTVVGPRYMGAAGRVADASKISVAVAEPSASGGPSTGAKASLALAIADVLTGAPESSSHSLDAKRGGEGEPTRLRFGGDRGVALDRDVVVRWPVAGQRVGASLIAARPANPVHEGDGFALLTLVPPQATASFRSTARDLIVLIDTSGSMGGRPLTQAKRIVGAMIESLGPEDRIEMIEFGSRPVRFQKEPIAATRDGKRAARKWLDALGPSGCTEMHRAVIEALRTLRPDSQRQIVLVTDGYIGFEQEIVATLLQKLPEGVRLHTVGVGSSVNRSLTEAAARAGRGTELIVGLDEDVERVIPRILARTCAPLVTDLKLEGGAIMEVEAASVALPDLYAGAPAMLALRTRGAGEITVRGRTADGPWEARVDVPALALGEGAQGVAALFGRERVEDLEMQLSAGDSRDQARIDRAIEAVGIGFQISTRLTSWVAITEAITVRPGSDKLHVVQPHELADGLSVEGLGLRQASMVAGPMAGRAVSFADLDDDVDMDFEGGAMMVADEGVLTGWGGARMAADEESFALDSLAEHDGPAGPPRETMTMTASGSAPAAMPSPARHDALIVSGEDVRHSSRRGWWIVLAMLLVLIIVTALVLSGRCSPDEARPSDDASAQPADATERPTKEPTQP